MLANADGGVDGLQGVVKIADSLLEVLLEGNEVDRGDRLETTLMGDMFGAWGHEQGFAGDTGSVGDILKMTVNGTGVEVEMVSDAFERPIAIV